MSTLISTYLCIYLSDRRIIAIPGRIFICTFPGILVQTWCKSVNMRAVAPIVGVVIQPDRGQCRPGLVTAVSGGQNCKKSECGSSIPIATPNRCGQPVWATHTCAGLRLRLNGQSVNCSLTRSITEMASARAFSPSSRSNASYGRPPGIPFG